MPADHLVHLRYAPAIPGLRFRRFRGKADYGPMIAVLDAHTEGHKLEYANTLEDIELLFAHMTRCDPYRDMLFAEVEDEVIAFSRVWWRELYTGERIYISLGFLAPVWQRKGIGTAMLHHNERHLCEIASQHPPGPTKLFHAWASDRETGAQALFSSADYLPVRRLLEMTRPASKPLLPAPLPSGLQVRPVQPEHVRPIWEAKEEAYRDHWLYAPATEQDYQRWLVGPLFTPHLWKVAWDGDQVAGMTLNRLLQAENEKYGRKRGYTQDIFVRRPWRRRGLARALLTQSIRMFQEMGMEETALSVDSLNPRGAAALYESLGYQAVIEHTVYQKPMH